MAASSSSYTSLSAPMPSPTAGSSLMQYFAAQQHSRQPGPGPTSAASGPTSNSSSSSSSSSIPYSSSPSHYHLPRSQYHHHHHHHQAQTSVTSHPIPIPQQTQQYQQYPASSPCASAVAPDASSSATLPFVPQQQPLSGPGHNPYGPAGKDFCLVAEAARRAEMQCMMRDFGEVGL